MAKRKKATVDRKVSGYIAVRSLHQRGKFVVYAWLWYARPQAAQVWAAICGRPNGCGASKDEIYIAKLQGWNVAPLRSVVSIPVITKRK